MIIAENIFVNYKTNDRNISIDYPCKILIDNIDMHYFDEFALTKKLRLCCN